MGWYVHRLSHKKERNSAICNKLDGPKDYHTKWNKKEKDRYHMISLICRIQKNDTNELIYKTKTDSQTLKTNLWLPKGKGREEGRVRSLELTHVHYYI